MGRPTTCSVITEAAAWEIEQPLPSTATAATRSPSSRSPTVSSSPHTGL